MKKERRGDIKFDNVNMQREPCWKGAFLLYEKDFENERAQRKRRSQDSIGRLGVGKSGLS